MVSGDDDDDEDDDNQCKEDNEVLSTGYCLPLIRLNPICVCCCYFDTDPRYD